MVPCPGFPWPLAHALGPLEAIFLPLPVRRFASCGRWAVSNRYEGLSKLDVVVV